MILKAIEKQSGQFIIYEDVLYAEKVDNYSVKVYLGDKRYETVDSFINESSNDTVVELFTEAGFKIHGHILKGRTT